MTGERAVPRDMGGLVLQSPDAWHALPPLDAVVRVPVMLPDGELLTRPGYSSALHVFYAPDDGMRYVCADMTTAEALGVIEEALCRLPVHLRCRPGRCAVAELLPFVREIITGPTPLYVPNAPASRTGKTLLVDVCMIPGHGGAR